MLPSVVQTPLRLLTMSTDHLAPVSQRAAPPKPLAARRTGVNVIVSIYGGMRAGLPCWFTRSATGLGTFRASATVQPRVRRSRDRTEDFESWAWTRVLAVSRRGRAAAIRAWLRDNTLVRCLRALPSTGVWSRTGRTVGLPPEGPAIDPGVQWAGDPTFWLSQSAPRSQMAVS